MRKSFLAAIVPLIIISYSVSASAAEFVIGGGLAKDCSDAATHAADKSVVPEDAQRICTMALETQAMSGRDRAATYVNRGILSMVKGDLSEAAADFDTAITTDPDLAGAYGNRGAVRIEQRKFADGIADIDRALQLGAARPERSYYDRALALEQLGDVKGAYRDLLTAVQLNPEWQPPRRELTRFSVRSKVY